MIKRRISFWLPVMLAVLASGPLSGSVPPVQSRFTTPTPGDPGPVLRTLATHDWFLNAQPLLNISPGRPTMPLNKDHLSAAVRKTEAGAGGAKGAPERIIDEDGFRVQLDLSGQVLRVTVPEDRAWGNSSGKAEAVINPTLKDLAQPGFVPAAVLAQKAKQFDDGLYAAVDLAAERGGGKYAGKASLLRDLYAELAKAQSGPEGNVQPVLCSAAKLGKLDVTLSEKSRAVVGDYVKTFLSDTVRSKPISFYTWSPELAAIFQQDRMLQTELKGRPDIEALVRMLHSDQRARAAYEGYLTLVSRLTNPLAKPDLRPLLVELDKGKLDAPSRGVYFFPPSSAHETELVKKLYGDRPIPEGFNLADELIRRIRSGEISLKPTSHSGWYDYQTWALEPLVLPEKAPEATHLQMDESYRKVLVELFKGLLTLTRETHIKQLEIPAVGAAMAPRMIKIALELSAEPLPTFYLRRAQSYHFVREVLEGTFGATELGRLHRLTASGPMTLTLAEELRDMESLFLGASATVNHELGLGSEAGGEMAASIAYFKHWAAAFNKDPDLGQDARAMVPVFYDVMRQKTKVWVFLGWTDRPLEVSFASHPRAWVLDARGDETANHPPIRFEWLQTRIIYPVTAEVYVSKILDRNEFRRLCDTYKTRSAILQHLE